MKKLGWHLLAAALMLGTSTAALAQPRFGPPHPPPQAALDACANLKAGDACTFTLDGRTVDGTCRSGPDGAKVACAPAMPHQPPQGAIDACASRRSGDTCAFSIDGRQMEGACRTGPDGQGSLACAPNRPPHGGRHGPPAEAIAACANLREGDTCSFTAEGRTMDGACRAGPQGAPLGCAPKPPPEGMRR